MIRVVLQDRFVVSLSNKIPTGRNRVLICHAILGNFQQFLQNLVGIDVFINKLLLAPRWMHSDGTAKVHRRIGVASLANDLQQEGTLDDR
jgi:hypothetical protein